MFTQFADTLHYLTDQLKSRGIAKLEGVSGDTENPSAVAWRFSPQSNKKLEMVKPENELRVLIATDVLSEGQNLQDCGHHRKLRFAVGHHSPDSKGWSC